MKSKISPIFTKKTIYFFSFLLFAPILGLSLLQFKNSIKKINNIHFLEETIKGTQNWKIIDSSLTKSQIDNIIREKQINYHMTKSFYLKKDTIDIFVSFSWDKNKCMISAKSNSFYKKIGDWIENNFNVDFNWSGYTHKKYETKEVFCNLLFGYGQIVF